MASLHNNAFKELGQKGWAIDQIRSSLEQAGSQLSYVMVDDDVAGFALYKTVLDETELFTLAVDPAQQRVGVASRLLKTIANQLKKDGGAAFFLEVRCDNTSAIACYEKLGFTKIGMRKEYYTADAGAKIDASIYRLFL